jgi:murein DD-endopeptidase MepM/ murein hydrolase activator NlpD
MHTGIDFPAARGTAVVAAGRGCVSSAGFDDGGYGNLVVIQHRLGYTSWYGHLSRITTWVGERVSGGTRIGYVGSTGHSTGPHLHFEVRLNNVPINPVPYLLATTARVSLAARGLRCADPDAYRTAPIDDCRR